MASLEASAVKNGVVFAYTHRVETIEPRGNGYRIGFCVGHDKSAGHCQAMQIINCAGLGCEQIASCMGIDTKAA